VGPGRIIKKWGDGGSRGGVKGKERTKDGRTWKKYCHPSVLKMKWSGRDHSEGGMTPAGGPPESGGNSPKMGRVGKQMRRGQKSVTGPSQDPDWGRGRTWRLKSYLKCGEL